MWSADRILEHRTDTFAGVSQPTRLVLVLEVGLAARGAHGRCELSAARVGSVVDPAFLPPHGRMRARWAVTACGRTCPVPVLGERPVSLGDGVRAVSVPDGLKALWGASMQT